MRLLVVIDSSDPARFPVCEQGGMVRAFLHPEPIGMSLHGTYDSQNIFAQIIRGDLPCYTLYEDDDV